MAENGVLLWINGRQHAAHGVDPHESLLSYLRRQGYTGAKEGCAEGECGACAVAWRPPGQPAKAGYEAVNACLLQVVASHGADLWTVEGLAEGGPEGSLHPVQAAMANNGSSQCGYCTPGFVMSLFAQYYRRPRLPVSHALSGNLCRCTGYRPLRDVASALPPEPPSDRFVERASAAWPAPEPLRYEAGGTRYDRPTELNAALRLRADHPGARIVAGATDVGVEIGRDRQRAEHWIAIDRIGALRHVARTPAHLELGAGVTLAELEDHYASEIPMMAEWLPLFASRLIRTRATLGGNLVTASPIGDSAPLLLALDAEVGLTSVRGQRWLSLADFFVGYRETALAADELLTHVRLARRSPSHARFYKVSKRRYDDISCVSAAFTLEVESDRIVHARLAYGGVAATPQRALTAEASLQDAPLNVGTFRAARQALTQAFTPIDDVRGSAAYREAMVTGLFDKFCAEVVP